MNVLRLLIATVAMVTAVLLLMVISDIINPYSPIEVVIEPDMIILPEGESYLLVDDDGEYWNESANALGIDSSSMTIEQFKQHSKQ